jgi:tRNA U34 5-methylaminomethyl-2-thiouridine-forming methyltransferase MnmC
MKREIIKTEDGSNTLYMEEMDETYHSTHGAIQEAKHVFIQNGLSQFVSKDEVTVFELGFGTGLNCLLTYLYAQEHNIQLNYFGIEAYPVELELLNAMDYTKEMSDDAVEKYAQIHQSSWDEMNVLSSYFSLKKMEQKIQNFEVEKESIDLIYFDAFGPRAQSEMWDISVLKKMVDLLKPNGILVTYCAQGQFKRDLKSLGFVLEALAGPPGKREMTRATKSAFHFHSVNR